MCPLCIGTATLLVSSGTSAGGLATLLFRLRTRKHRPIVPFAGDLCREGEPEQKDLRSARTQADSCAAGFSGSSLSYSFLTTA
jgi:hypothetical protein